MCLLWCLFEYYFPGTRYHESSQTTVLGTGPHCVWASTGQLELCLILGKSRVQVLSPKTDFLKVFGSHQELMLLFLPEDAHTYCTSRRALTSVNGHYRGQGVKQSTNLRLLLRLGMRGVVPRIVHSPAVITIVHY